MFSVGLLFIIATAMVSIPAFSNRQLFDKYKFNAYQIHHKREYIRLFSHGFLHADWGHLIFNMLTLYFFSDTVISVLGTFNFSVLYLLAIGAASLPALKKHKDDISYNSIGASGAVSAILFASILINPWQGIMLMILPIPIPGFVFGILYLVYSSYMNKKQLDNIGHDAHFWGAVFGFVMPIFIKPELLSHFINQLI